MALLTLVWEATQEVPSGFLPATVGCWGSGLLMAASHWRTYALWQGPTTHVITVIIITIIYRRSS